MQTSNTEDRTRSLEIALVETKAELRGDIQALSVKLDEHSNRFEKQIDSLDKKFWAILTLLIGQSLALLIAIMKLFGGL